MSVYSILWPWCYLMSNFSLLSISLNKLIRNRTYLNKLRLVSAHNVIYYLLPCVVFIDTWTYFVIHAHTNV